MQYQKGILSKYILNKLEISLKINKRCILPQNKEIWHFQRKKNDWLRVAVAREQGATASPEGLWHKVEGF